MEGRCGGQGVGNWSPGRVPAPGPQTRYLSTLLRSLTPAPTPMPASNRRRSEEPSPQCRPHAPSPSCPWGDAPWQQVPCRADQSSLQLECPPEGGAGSGRGGGLSGITNSCFSQGPEGSSVSAPGPGLSCHVWG